MRRGPHPRAFTVALCLAAGAAVAGCGSGTTTVTAPGVAGTAQQVEAATTTPTGTTHGTATANAPAPTSTAGGTEAPSATRTAPEPAFTETGGSATGGGVASAAATVRARGFTPKNTADFHPGQTLQVLVATRTGSGDGYGQRAFFFVNGHYIGTDAKEPSASVKVVSQGDTEVTLAYPLYRAHDPLCCPGGGQATVRFQLDNGRLTALGTIPPATRSAALSRY